MPANLTPNYYAAEEKYKQAKDDRERMKALKDMLANIPKHKGTERLQGDIKRKIARLKDEIDVKKAKGGHRFSFSVDREGAAQVVVIGSPNVGKSHMISSLTETNLEIGDYPFTTRMFHPAMMPFEDIQVQLVDLPPISDDYLENWVPSIIRLADMALLVVDTSRDDLLDQIESTFSVLGQFKIKLHGLVEMELDDPLHWIALKTIFIANKMDLSSARENLAILDEFYNDQFQIIGISSVTNYNLEIVKQNIIDTMKIIRVYSKRPGHPAEMDKPFTFQIGSTLLEFAKAVHKDFSQNLKFARVWGKDVFDGQRINKDYLLQDKDIIELHL